jgi:hypothetical protein
MGHRIQGYGFTLIQLWFEGTRFTPNELKFL